MFVPAPLVLPLLGNGILSDFKEEEVKVPPDDDLTDFWNLAHMSRDPSSTLGENLDF